MSCNVNLALVVVYVVVCIASAEDFKQVQKEVAEIIEGRVLVGHAIHNDMRV